MLAGFGNTALALGFAITLGASPSLTRPAAVLVVAMGIAAWALWFSGPPPSPNVLQRGRLAIWAVIFAAFGTWELAAYLLGDDQNHPTFSRLADPMLSWPPARAAAGLGWVIWGRHLATLNPPNHDMGSS